jgi:hypothetical protein
MPIDVRRRLGWVGRLFSILFGTSGLFILMAALDQLGEMLSGRRGDPVALIWLAILASPFLLLAALLIVPLLWKPVAVPPPPALGPLDEGIEFTCGAGEFPVFAAWRRQPGWVLVDINFDRDGLYSSHEVVQDAPPKVFRRTVANMLRSSNARRTDGSPPPVKVQTVVRFALPPEEL